MYFHLANVAEHDVAVSVLLAVTGSEHLLDTRPLLNETWRTRDQYLRPPQLMQIQLLERVRHVRAGGDEVDEVLQRVLLLTINGIATGRQHGLIDPCARTAFARHRVPRCNEGTGVTETRTGSAYCK